MSGLLEDIQRKRDEDERIHCGTYLRRGLVTELFHLSNAMKISKNKLIEELLEGAAKELRRQVDESLLGKDNHSSVGSVEGEGEK